LINKGLDACAGSGCGYIVVLGDPNYYRRFGFEPATKWRLVDEYGGKSAFQAMELQTGTIPAAGGTVKYAPEFNIVEEEADN
jgi:putative acetyltransferase